MPTNFVFMAFYFVLSKGQYISSPLLGRTLRALTARPTLAVYANSFFAALNTRRSVRGRGTEGDHTTVPTFLMVGQTTTIKHEGGNDNPILSTVSWLG